MRKLSRTKIELFLDCKLCFYLNQNCRVKRPDRAVYHLNNAVDFLLKKEFDHYRLSGTAHPLMKQNGISAVPYFHDLMDRWREPLHGGLQVLDEENDFLLTGAPDDIWINSSGFLHIVDYKATRALSQESLDAKLHPEYKRQLEFYAYLLEKMGFKVSNEGYFVVAEAKLNKTALNHNLNFDLHLLRSESSWDWVPDVLKEIKELLASDESPAPSSDCIFCKYAKNRNDLLSAPIQMKLY